MTMIDASIDYTIVTTRMGLMLLAATRRGVCQVAFGDEEPALIGAVHARFPFAAAERDDVRLKRWAERLVAYVDGHATQVDVPLDVSGTRFQREVWKALRRIPRGTTRSYGELARGLGRVGGARAVAQACAANPVPIAIPCHRVVPAAGAANGVGGYAWGTARKRALLESEGAAPAEAAKPEPSCQR